MFDLNAATFIGFDHSESFVRTTFDTPLVSISTIPSTAKTYVLLSKMEIDWLSDNLSWEPNTSGFLVFAPTVITLFPALSKTAIWPLLKLNSRASTPERTIERSRNKLGETWAVPRISVWTANISAFNFSSRGSFTPSPSSLITNSSALLKNSRAFRRFISFWEMASAYRLSARARLSAYEAL